MKDAARWLRHAFAVDGAGPSQPTDDDRQLIDRLCVEIVRRRLTTPALMLLEMGRPLHYVSAQLLHAMQPFIGVLGDPVTCGRVARFLEQRGAVDYVADRLEAIARADADRRRINTGAAAPASDVAPARDQ